MSETPHPIIANSQNVDASSWYIRGAAENDEQRRCVHNATVCVTCNLNAPLALADALAAAVEAFASHVDRIGEMHAYAQMLAAVKAYRAARQP